MFYLSIFLYILDDLYPPTTIFGISFDLFSSFLQMDRSSASEPLMDFNEELVLSSDDIIQKNSFPITFELDHRGR